jgi:porin
MTVAFTQRMTKALRIIIFIFLLYAVSVRLLAQESNNSSWSPSFGVDYTGEVQTDFEKARAANLLHLQADLPISKKFSFQIGSISTLTTDELLEIADFQGLSNIDAYENIPFALTVAGLTWRFNDKHSLFAGIRRTDEDYFCSDAIGLFTNSSCGIFPTISMNFPIGVFPYAAMGIHYIFDNNKLCLQASLYNGEGNNDFTGRYNVFRICPKTDGVFAIGQAEYRYGNSHYYLGGSLHTEPTTKPTVWAYAEQLLSPQFTLLAAYGHAFGKDNFCDNFYGLGGIYSFKRADFGLFTDYTNVLDMNEWATELLCNIHINDYFSVKPVLHIINNDGETNSAAIFRVEISL